MTGRISLPQIDAIAGCSWESHGGLHCKTPEALEAALEVLRTIGYDIQDLRNPGPGIEPFAPIEQMEDEGWTLWFATLDVKRTKCSSCGNYIEDLGINVHGHQCEYCGQVTFRELVQGTEIQFAFAGDKYRGQMPRLIGTVECWKVFEGLLYLAPLTDLTKDQRTYLDQHRNEWAMTTKNGKTLMRVVYHNRREGVRPDSAIRITLTIAGHKKNYTQVLIWDGAEYNIHEYDQLPYPRSINVYEDWRRV